MARLTACCDCSDASRKSDSLASLTPPTSPSASILFLNFLSCIATAAVHARHLMPHTYGKCAGVLHAVLADGPKKHLCQQCAQTVMLTG